MQLDTDWNGLSPDSVVIESVTRHKFIYCRATTFQTERTNSYNLKNTLIEGDIAVFRNPQISPS